MFLVRSSQLCKFSTVNSNVTKYRIDCHIKLRCIEEEYRFRKDLLSHQRSILFQQEALSDRRCWIYNYEFRKTSISA